jgi:hypothetical protein
MANYLTQIVNTYGTWYVNDELRSGLQLSLNTSGESGYYGVNLDGLMHWCHNISLHGWDSDQLEVTPGGDNIVRLLIHLPGEDIQTITWFFTTSGAHTFAVSPAPNIACLFVGDVTIGDPPGGGPTPPPTPAPEEEEDVVEPPPEEEEDVVEPPPEEEEDVVEPPPTTPSVPSTGKVDIDFKFGTQRFFRIIYDTETGVSQVYKADGPDSVVELHSVITI